MAVILSCTERTARLRNVARMYIALAQKSAVIDRITENRFSEGAAPADIVTDIGGMLADLNSLTAEAATESGKIGMTFQAAVRPGNPHLHRGVFVAQGQDSWWLIGPLDATRNWKGVFVKDDVLALLDAEDSANDGRSITAGNTPDDTDIGVELVGNGDFATGDGGTPEGADGWTNAGAWDTHWAWTAGKVTHLTGTETLTHTFADAPTNGAAIRNHCQFTVADRTAGSVTVAVGSRLRTVSANGTYSIAIVSGADLVITPTTDFDGSITNVSAMNFGGIACQADDLVENSEDTKMRLVLQER
jgi:hypothetical protein